MSRLETRGSQEGTVWVSIWERDGPTSRGQCGCPDQRQFELPLVDMRLSNLETRVSRLQEEQHIQT